MNEKVRFICYQPAIGVLRLHDGDVGRIQRMGAYVLNGNPTNETG